MEPITVKSITPIIDEMRWVKDDKEIAVLRECGRIGALGFNEAMKVTRPEVYEYQVVAACDFFLSIQRRTEPGVLCDRRLRRARTGVALQRQQSSA